MENCYNVQSSDTVIKGSQEKSSSCMHTIQREHLSRSSLLFSWFIFSEQPHEGAHQIFSEEKNIFGVFDSKIN